jgi:hypothetical protein
MDIDWTKFHELTKKYDPAAHYVMDGIWKSSTKTVNKTANAIDNSGWVEDTSAKDEKNFDRWFENSVGSVAAIFGGMYAAGAMGGGSAAATGGTGIGATSGATGSGMVAGASGGGTGAGLSANYGAASSLGNTGLGISGTTGAGIGGTQTASQWDWLKRTNLNQQQNNSGANQQYAARALRSDGGYQPGPGWIDTTKRKREA